MTFDDHANLAISAVVTAPSPADSGTSLVVTTGEGARFPTPPFNVTVWATGAMPTPDNAEIARVTAISTDTFTITRAAEPGATARTIVAGDLIAATVTAKTLTDLEQNTDTYGPWYLRGPKPYIDPMHNYYGAVGDGTADDTDALQNALDDAHATTNGSDSHTGTRVELPGGTYRITESLHVRATGSPWQGGISLIGSGPLITTISSEVEADFAIRHESQKYDALGGFRLLNGTGSRGTTGGILFTGAPDSPGTGSQNSGHLISQLTVHSYSTGLQFGEGDFRASELTFLNLVVQDNDIGIDGFGQNSLNFNFQQLIMFSNGYGLKANGAGSILVFGGASNMNEYDFFFEELATAGIYGFRSETWGNRVLYAGPAGTAPFNLVLDGLKATDNSGPADGGCLELVGGTQATIQSCYIGGKIFIHDSNLRLTMNTSAVNDTQLIRPTSTGDLVGVSLNATGCVLIDPSFISSFEDTTVGATYNDSDELVGGLQVSTAGIISSPQFKPPRSETWGLVSSWGLGDLVDTYGTNDLTNVNSATFGVGHLGNAAYLAKASTQHLDVADNPGLHVKDQDFLIATWVYLTDKTTSQGIVSKTAAGLYDFDLYYYNGDDRFRWYVEKPSGAFTDLAASTFGSPSAGAWHLAIGCHDSVSNLLSISIDAGAWDSAAHTGGVRGTSGPIQFGVEGSSANPLGGRLDGAHFFKAPPGGIAAVKDAIRDFLWNGGTGREYGVEWDDGAIVASSLRLTTSPSAGYVMTSDADGDASWQAAGAASVSFEDIAQWWVD